MFGIRHTFPLLARGDGRGNPNLETYQADGYRVLFEKTKDAVSIADWEGRFLDLNPAALRLFGYTKEEIFGMKTVELYADPSQRALVMNELREKGYTDGLEVKFQTKDGNTIDCLLSSTVQTDSSGKIVSIQSIIRDISKRKAMERELQEELGDFFENGPLGLHWINKEGIILRANRAELELLGYDEGEYVGHYIGNFHKDQDAVTDILKRLQRNETLANYEARMRCKDGSVKHVMISSNVYWRGDEFVYGRCFMQDVTERRELEERLHRARIDLETRIKERTAELSRINNELKIKQMELTEAQQISHIGSWNWDIATDEISWSDELFRIFGIPPGSQNLTFESYLKLIHPDDREFVKLQIEKGYKSGKPFSFDHRIVRPDGVIRVVHGRGEVIYDSKGEPVKMIGTAQDVTERSRAEEVLKRSEEYFRCLIENASDIITIVNSEGVIRYESPSLTRILGYRPEAIIGQSLFGFVHPDDLPEVTESFKEILANPGAVQSITFRFLHKDGGWHTLEVSSKNLLDNPIVVGIIINCRDISKRRRVQEKLRENEERFALLLDGVKDYAIYMLDPQGRVVSWSSGAERVNGFSAEEMIGQSFSIFYPEEDRKNNKYLEDLRKTEEGGHTETERQRVRKNGTVFWGNVVMTALRDDNGNLRGFAVVTKDVTERKLLEQAKEDFISTATHELRTPLTALQGYISLLDQSQEELSQKQRVHLERAARASKRLLNIVEDLLSVIRLEAKPNTESGNFSLASLVNETIGEFATRAEQEKKQLILETQTDYLVVGNMDYTKKVLGNLLENAIKYTPSGGQISVSYGEEVLGKDLVISIKDNGVGVAKEYTNQIFSKFFRAPNPLSVAAGGTGLGLYIAKQLLEMQGGRIWVDSHPGRGSTFSFTLPKVIKE